MVTSSQPRRNARPVKNVLAAGRTVGVDGHADRALGGGVNCADGGGEVGVGGGEDGGVGGPVQLCQCGRVLEHVDQSILGVVGGELGPVCVDGELRVEGDVRGVGGDGVVGFVVDLHPGVEREVDVGADD